MKLNPDFVRAFFMQAHGVLVPTLEYRFHPTRKWRFDLAWVGDKLALECQGGIWSRGRHVRGAALLKEWEKLNTAAIMGWRILYCQPRDLLTTKTADMVWAALTGEKQE